MIELPTRAGKDDAASLLDVDGALVDGVLVDAYYEALLTAFVARGAARDLDDAAARIAPRAEFDRQFEAGVVDMARLVFAYQWPRIDASPKNLRSHASVAARNSYNKNVRNAVWLVARTDLALRRRFESGD